MDPCSPQQDDAKAVADVCRRLSWKPSDEIDVSVVTPTYNRAHTLARLFTSLCVQSRGGFEWVVVDDGSTDDTPELLQRFANRDLIPIRWVRQPNCGRHVALNRGIAEARGQFIVFMDSDDWLMPEGLERLLLHWELIPPALRCGFVGVAGLCVDPHGMPIGSLFPQDSFDSDFVEIRATYGVSGDKKELLRSDVLRQYPFPVFPAEKRVPTSLVLNRIARKYRTRFVNEVVTVKEYLPGGLSATLDRVRASSPLGSRLRYREAVELGEALPPRQRMRACANYVRYSMHAGIGLAEQLRDVPDRLLWAASLPIGAAVYLKDRHNIARAAP